jgi:hypothetical protein
LKVGRPPRELALQAGERAGLGGITPALRT